MEGGAYGAGKAGSAVDPISFLKQPQTILRIFSWIFSIVVFGSIVNEGYVNKDSNNLYCVFNKNNNACNYGIAIGTFAFFVCILFLTLDLYFPQISSVKDRKYVVLADLGFSGLWTFLWFVGFCFLENQWQITPSDYLPLNQGADAARAAIAFCFFSILSWGYLTLFAFNKFKNVGFAEDAQRLVPQPSSSSQIPWTQAKLHSVLESRTRKPFRARRLPKTWTQPPRDIRCPHIKGHLFI
uniref:synaptogyrin-3a isoform X1 n=1 Tax=Pristiophorus japonicus TaxID=55135 RepID=UPI00398EE77E